IGMEHRVPFRRRLRQTGEHRRLRQVELRGRQLEVALRGSLDAVRLRAVEALVEVELHDLVLAVGLAQLVGQRQLLDLAADRLVGREELLLGKLLGDRAATTYYVAGADVVEGRADDSGRVKAGVGVETPVLDGDGRLDGDGSDTRELHRD